MNKVKKDQLAKVVGDKLELSNKDGKVVVDTVFDSVLELLVNHDEVSLGSLGKLAKVERAARKGRNPQTGEEIEIASKVAPKFKPGKALKDAVK